jgi:hypothetical protein
MRLNQNPEEPNKVYVPPRVASKELGISLPVLALYRRQGIIPWVPMGVKGLARFCVADVRAALAALTPANDPTFRNPNLQLGRARLAVQQAREALANAEAQVRYLEGKFAHLSLPDNGSEESFEESNQPGLHFEH